MKKFLILFFVFCIFNIFNVALAVDNIKDVQNVTIEGESAIVDSEVTAESSAVAQALRNAIEQVTGVYVSSETKVSNFEVLKDEIYTKASGFVSDYKILEKQKRKNTIWVKINATVSLEPLADSLKKLGLLRKWTIAVLLNSSDPKLAELGAVDSAKSSIDEIILGSGFKVVDQEVMASLENPTIMNQIIAGNYMAASQILRDNGVDILVIGKVSGGNFAGKTIDAYGIDVSLNTGKGKIDAKLIRADTGELLATKTFEGSAVGAKDTISEALKKSGETAGNYFVKEIMKLPASTTSYIQLSVKGLTYSKTKNFENALKQVKNIIKTTAKGYRNNTALFEVEIEGDVNLLADNLSENKELSNNFKFEIKSLSAGKIEASVK